MYLITKAGIPVFYDKSDHKLVSQFTWRVSKTGKKFYAITTLPDGTTIYMHRLILGLKPDDKRIVDHKNGCTVNNKRRNIRATSHKVNAWNMRYSKHNSLGYEGVVFIKASGKFQSRIYIDGKRRSLGYFNTAKKAGRAYSKKYAELQREILRAA